MGEKRRKSTVADGGSSSKKKHRSADPPAAAAPDAAQAPAKEAAVPAVVPAAVTNVPVVPPLSPIASPLASKKLTKRLYKLVAASAKGRTLRRGIKEVVKAVRQHQKGVCIIAGDVMPLDVICHLPLLCEDAAVPYVFTPRKEELGAASCTKRPTSVVLVTAGNGKDKELSQEAREELNACVAEVAGLRTTVST
ncbi:hypothetical protein MMPV_002622 [Pyropia vietnamensis]